MAPGVPQSLVGNCRYFGPKAPNANYGGGSYINCGDSKHPGVSAVVDYLGDLERPVGSRCDKGNYYLVNNYNPDYFGDGSNAYTDNFSQYAQFGISDGVS